MSLYIYLPKLSIIFHQPRFPWNFRGPISLPKRYLLGEIGKMWGRYNLTRYMVLGKPNFPGIKHIFPWLFFTVTESSGCQVRSKSLVEVSGSWQIKDEIFNAKMSKRTWFQISVGIWWHFDNNIYAYARPQGMLHSLLHHRYEHRFSYSWTSMTKRPTEFHQISSNSLPHRPVAAGCDGCAPPVALSMALP